MENLPATISGSMFLDVQKFEFAQRVGNMLCKATMVPDHFRNNLGNIMIALNFAERIQADPFMVMQSMYIVHGKPGVEAKLVIALLNSSGRFEPIEFEETGNLSKPTNDADGCVAFAKENKSGKLLRGPKIDWAMVKAEGWLGKNGSKWKTMAPLMFRYRAAAYFARTYCPEVLLGMQTREELNDVIDIRQNDLGQYETDISTPGEDKNVDMSIYGGNPKSEPETGPAKVKVSPDGGTEQVPPASIAGLMRNSGANSRPPEGYFDQNASDKPGPPDQAGSVNGNEPGSTGWDPRTEPLMGRYYPEKQAAVQTAAEEMGVPTNAANGNPRPWKDVHADIIALHKKTEVRDLEEQGGSTDTKAPQESSKDKQGREPSKRETFLYVMDERGVADEEIGDLNAYVYHCAKTTGKTNADIFDGAMKNPAEFIKYFRAWKSNPMQGDGEQDGDFGGEQPDNSHDDEVNRNELRDQILTIAHGRTEEKYKAVVNALCKSGQLPGTFADEWSIEQMEMVLDGVAEKF